MTEMTWNTAITSIKPNEVRLRGYRLDEMMGRLGFSSVIYLALIGELPSESVSKMLDAIFIASIDHGATPPSALAARTAASTGSTLNGALAAGILSINRFHGGAIEGCMEILREALRRHPSEETPFTLTALELVREYRAHGKRIPGLGHRIHTSDPRTQRLFELAKEYGIAGYGIAMLEAIHTALANESKALPINVDGAIAAILVDLDIPLSLANAFFILARVPGLVAHITEEQQREKPMRRIHPTDHAYDGPSPRRLADT